MNADVELISTGTELLDGRVVNTHARDLARGLAEVGHRLSRETSVHDDAAAIRQAVADALTRADVVVVSGGLGPTSDDVTREAVAEIAGSGLVMHEPSRRSIHAWYARRGKPLNSSVDRHALVIEGARVLPNSVGLAPGEEIRVGTKTVFLVPGPPYEFVAILREHLLPALAARGVAVRPDVRMFQACGIGESDAVSRWAGADFPGPGVEVAYCAKIAILEIRLWATPVHRAALDRAAAIVREKLGAHLFTEDTRPLEEVVGALLRARGATLAVAESCTGGLALSMLTDVGGSSGYVQGGVVAYANAAKTRELGVDAGVIEQAGAVSAEVARAMAEGARRRWGTTYGMGITGVAGPSGGTEAKPVGLVYMAVADAAGTIVLEQRFAGPRAIIKESSARMALDLLRRRLIGAPTA